MMTVAEIEARVRALRQVVEWIEGPLDGPVIGAIEDLDALRPLVEDAECKRRIEAAGFAWAHRPYSKAFMDRTIGLWSESCPLGSTSWFVTWPESAAWAEEQAAKRERWSKHTKDMTTQEVVDTLLQIGGTVSDFASSTTMHLVGYARGKGIYDEKTDRIRLSQV